MADEDDDFSDDAGEEDAGADAGDDEEDVGGDDDEAGDDDPSGSTLVNRSRFPNPLEPITTQEILAFLQNPNSEDAQRLLRRAALSTLAPRAASIQENLLRQRRLSVGSARETIATFNQEIAQLQQQLQSASQTIGRQGGLSLGGQRNILRGQAVGTAANQLQGLFDQAGRQGTAGLINASTGVTGTLSTQLPPPRSSVQTGPVAFDVEGLGGSTINLARQLQRLFTQQPTGATPAGGLAFGSPRGSSIGGPNSPFVQQPVLTQPQQPTPQQQQQQAGLEF